MDILGLIQLSVLLDEVLIYGFTALIGGMIVMYYAKKEKRSSKAIAKKVIVAKEEGMFEPVSLHPHIDLTKCIGSGACVSSCPEKDILGIVDGVATVINASSCIGHGACFHACPVEAISLRIGTETRGVELPQIKPNYETNISGIYIAGELGGMGLIKNSTEQGKQAVENIVKSGRINKEGIHDIIIVGAGPAGIAAALTAKDNGLNFEILEQDSLGGTVFTFPRAKVVMTHPMDLPLLGKVKLFDTSKEELLKIWTKVLSDNNISVTEHSKVDRIVPLEKGEFKVCVEGKDGAEEKEYIASNVVIAIGRRGSPRKLGVPGEMSKKVAYRLLEPENIKGNKILVVGGGDSAVESAMLLMEENEVILSYRKDKFARIKSENRRLINEAIENKKLKMIYNSNLLEIKEDFITLCKEGVDAEKEIENIKNDLVYIFAGGELPIKFLKNAGINVEKKFGKIVREY
ncbi:MAG: 4Fe-4S ferredoxin [Bacteroidetes bacterium]|nr:MAG: 4Fe-4S ferredoxin [Bacteroidota bacterium]